MINYSVVGGLTEPSNPIENMIWIETNIEITKHIISKNEPKNPIEGMVCIYLSDNSNVSFHALNINGEEFDEVFPISAKQYVNGAWMDKTAKSYQGGEWVNFERFLYKNGVLYEGQSIVEGTDESNKVTIGSNCVEIRMTAKNQFAVFNLSEPVDMTNISAIKVTIFNYYDYSSDLVGDWDTQFSVALSVDDAFMGFNVDNVYTRIGTMSANTEYVLTLDTSAVTGMRYILFPITSRSGQYLWVDMKAVEVLG